jgi:hypothetical protein
MTNFFPEKFIGKKSNPFGAAAARIGQVLFL